MLCCRQRSKPRFAGWLRRHARITAATLSPRPVSLARGSSSHSGSPRPQGAPKDGVRMRVRGCGCSCACVELRPASARFGWSGCKLALPSGCARAHWRLPWRRSAGRSRARLCRRRARACIVFTGIMCHSVFTMVVVSKPRGAGKKVEISKSARAGSGIPLGHKALALPAT